MKEERAVTAVVEEWLIPTYPSPAPEEMPMFAETRIHQGTSGNPYPRRVVTKVDREHRAERPYTVVRLENEYIRVVVIPELGGRIFEAYDKVTGYDFLYRQHVIKPALIGAYGSWISGGIEFNWPYHHRPSTMMPVDFRLERTEDGGAVVWLSEHEPCDRMKGTVGILLRPGASYFETRAEVSNRTPYKHSFLWWENAAVAVHEEYRLVFPPDVTWVHHHYDRAHTTFPMASGRYGAENLGDGKDISWHKNSRQATSYFSAPSKYDFFGGFDYRRNCGVLHIADHHLSPGKKMFTWGYGENADNWEKKLTDSDGQYAELMAGVYTDDQPDFTWLAPYESKRFSQYWYPTMGIGYATCASIAAAVAFDREKGEVRLNSTAVYPGARLCIRDEKGNVLLEKTADLSPSVCTAFPFAFPEKERLSLLLLSADGERLLSYTEEANDYIHIPKDNPGIPLPDRLTTPNELTVAGAHVDQYRDPLYTPDIYYRAALERDPDFLPALLAMGEYHCRTGRYEEALPYLERAHAAECRYNQNPEDGRATYLLGTAYRALGRETEAYDTLRRAAWSQNVISPAMTAVAALDGCRGRFDDMLTHALSALEKETHHPIAGVYAALALWRLGEGRRAAATLSTLLDDDPMNHLARYALTCVTGRGRTAFLDGLFSDPAQTALDIGFDLLHAGFTEECLVLFREVLRRVPEAATLRYALAYCYETSGDGASAARERKRAGRGRIVDVFPSRPDEAVVLSDALRRNEKDGFAAYLLGCCRHNERLYGQAAALYERAVANMPDFYIPYRNLAILYFNRLGRKEEALRLLCRADELHPQDERLLCEIATVMEKNGVPGGERAAYLLPRIPADAGDALYLTVARAYNAAGEHDRALAVMASHEFYPSEGGEYATAEPYMFAHFAVGRRAMREGDYEKALREFRAATALPENLHTGFWNDSVLMPYRYGEIAALKALGRDGEAAPLIEKTTRMKNEGMWNMGDDFVYYAACVLRLGGEELRAGAMMRNAVLGWEAERAEGCRYYRAVTGDFVCFLSDQTAERLAALDALLAYGKLYFGETAEAAALFRRSLDADPSNIRAALELELLQK